MYLALIGSIESQLRAAYENRHAAGLDTQASVAEKLGVDRSVVNRRLLGHTNMTAETIADMAWALGQSVALKIFDPFQEPTNEAIVISQYVTPALSHQIAAASTVTPVTVTYDS
jgi:transcriptional regulator with XRE-family HTH domain